MTTTETLTETLYSDNTQEFVDLANGLAAKGTIESVGVLLASFIDDFDYYDEMSVLMHAIERVEPTVVYESLAKGLKKLNETAPGWCKELVKRHLRAPGNGEEGGFSVAVFVNAMRSDPQAFSVTESIAKKLVAENHVPSDVLSQFTM